MTTLQTGIAVALALIVIGVVFIFPNLSPFSLLGASQPASTTTGQQQAAVLESNGAGASSTPPVTSLEIQDEVVGTGAAAKTGDTVTVNYVGALQDGTVFDASANHGQPFSFKLGAGQVIAGWDQGLVGMKVGGKRILVIPPSLAYGSAGVGNVIPPNSTLIFEVELVSIQ